MCSASRLWRDIRLDCCQLLADGWSPLRALCIQPGTTGKAALLSGATPSRADSQEVPGWHTNRLKGRVHMELYRTRVGGVVLATILAVSGLAGAAPATAAEPTVEEVATAPDFSQTASLDSDTINDALDSLAKLFAVAVTDETLRKDIYNGVAEKFDGDANVLYRTLVTTSGVRSGLADAYRLGLAGQPTETEALSAVDSMVNDVPRFQVAVPDGLDAWDPGAYAPLVAYMPDGVDDTTLQTVTAYDAAGKAYTLDAQVAPTEPVIVLGLNERTDDAGALLPPFSDTWETEPTDPPSAQGSYQVRMVKVNLINDKEPWARGSAEISMRAKGAGLSYGDSDWASLNQSEDWWYGPRELGTTTGDVRFVWWEDDGGDFDFTLEFKGVGLSIKMCDCDDQIGNILLDNATFSGTSEKKSEWSALDMWTD